MRLTKFDKQAIVRAIMQDVPKIDKDKRAPLLQAAIVKAMSPACRKVYEKTPDALRHRYVGSIISDYSSREVVQGDVNDSTIEDLLAPYKAEDKARCDAQTKLTGAVEACTTVKQLEARLPEFKKYFPKAEASSTNLPALANVVADLSKLGWPKTSTK